jgi:pimeloyl-ACP methyl ester carboxylesterase
VKTVLFCPGFGDGLHTRDYTAVIQAIRSNGYKVKFIPINWKRTAITSWVAQLEKEYNKHDPAETILAGFSYGSMTAFVAASHKNPAELWLFSLSCYFAEDIPYIKKWWANIIGKRRIEAFKKLTFSETVKNIHCPTTIMLGELEVRYFELLSNRCTTAHKAIKNSRLLIVPHTRHDIAAKSYIAAIKDAT